MAAGGEGKNTFILSKQNFSDQKSGSKRKRRKCSWRKQKNNFCKCKRWKCESSIFGDVICATARNSMKKICMYHRECNHYTSLGMWKCFQPSHACNRNHPFFTTHTCTPCFCYPTFTCVFPFSDAIHSDILCKIEIKFDKSEQWPSSMKLFLNLKLLLISIRMSLFLITFTHKKLKVSREKFWKRSKIQQQYRTKRKRYNKNYEWKKNLL